MLPKKAPAVAAPQGAAGGAEAHPATPAGNPAPPHSLAQAAIAAPFT